MKRTVFALLIILALGALSGCAGATSPPTGPPVSGQGTPGSGPTAPDDREFKMVGKDVMFLHVTQTYDPALFPKNAMTGEPSTIPFFKPVKDEGPIPRDYPAYDAKTFKFLVMMSTIIPPQDYYMFTKGSLNTAVANTGYKFAEILDGGHVKILPNLYLGYYDFAWVPLNVMTEYWSGNESMNQELWRDGNDYLLVGAAYNGGVSLIASPTVTNLSELANNKIGIMNPSFNQEAMLNKKLGTIGLATESAGGNVAVEMGTPGTVMNDMMAGDLKAVIAWASYEVTLREKFKFKELVKWSDMGYGKKAPYMVLVVRSDIAKKHPDIVQSVVQANYDATQQALKSTEYQADIFARTDYFKSHFMGMTVKANSLNPALTNLDAEASPVFLKDVYDYMVKCGYFKNPYEFSELVDGSFFAKVKK